MIEQLPIYLLCFLMGWVPLYYVYRQTEAIFPFKLKNSTTTISIFPFLYLLYLTAEIFRGYAVMFIVHEWLVYDLDLIVGVLLFLIAVGHPFFVKSTYRSALWVSISGIYLYLFPLFIWVLPIILILMFFLGQKHYVSYGVIGSFFLLLGIIQGGNSLYIGLYFTLFFFLTVSSYLKSY